MPTLTKTSHKKRSAPSSSHRGPKPKKVHIETPSAAKQEKKRSRPVTAPPVVVDDPDSGNDDDEDHEGDSFGDEGDWVDEDDGGGGGDDDDFLGDEAEPMDEDEPTKLPTITTKDPNGVFTPSLILSDLLTQLSPTPAARESHKAQKLLTEQRRAAKPHSSLLVDAKRVWSLARQKNNITTAERQTHVRDLMGVIRGHVKDIVFKHDASRIVQTVVKYGGQKERDEVAVELKGKYKDLAQNKYSKVFFPFTLRSSSSLFLQVKYKTVPGDEIDSTLSGSSGIYPAGVPDACPAPTPPPGSHVRSCRCI